MGVWDIGGGGGGGERAGTIDMLHILWRKNERVIVKKNSTAEIRTTHSNIVTCESTQPRYRLTSAPSLPSLPIKVTTSNNLYRVV